jgi:hypothetical protein
MPAAILRLGERQGRKIVVVDVYDEATDPDAELEDGDEPQFFVTVVPYVDRDDIDAISEELDAEQWADLIETDGIRHRLESSRPRTDPGDGTDRGARRLSKSLPQEATPLQSSPGMIRFMNSSNSGTVNAVSP